MPFYINWVAVTTNDTKLSSVVSTCCNLICKRHFCHMLSHSMPDRFDYWVTEYHLGFILEPLRPAGNIEPVRSIDPAEPELPGVGSKPASLSGWPADTGPTVESGPQNPPTGLTRGKRFSRSSGSRGKLPLPNVFLMTSVQALEYYDAVMATFILGQT